MQSNLRIYLLFLLALGCMCAILADEHKPQIEVGKQAPDFSLPDTTGKQQSLKQFRGKKNVVLFFYPALFRAGG